MNVIMNFIFHKKVREFLDQLRNAHFLRNGSASWSYTGAAERSLIVDRDNST
jgi:hypothetical protein